MVTGDRFSDTLTGETFDMEDGQPEAKLDLAAYVMDQSCKPE